MKKKFIDYFMKIAKLTAALSYAKRLQVGAVIVKGNQIIATGYNGTPAGWDNVCETKEWCDGGGWLDVEYIEQNWPYEGTYQDITGNEVPGKYRLKTKPEVLHAEMNSLMKVARSTESSDGATLFCTHAPCLDCAKAIYQAGISEVVYSEEYRSEQGLAFLRDSGVKITQHADD